MKTKYIKAKDVIVSVTSDFGILFHLVNNKIAYTSIIENNVDQLGNKFITSKCTNYTDDKKQSVNIHPRFYNEIIKLIFKLGEKHEVKNKEE